jgi:hypothetical protein
MRSIAIGAVIIALTACNAGDDRAATDTAATTTGASSGALADTAGGVAPATGATGTAATTGTGTMGTADTGGAAGSSRGTMGDTAQNQTQSGVTDSSGKSTLGPNVKKTEPTQGQAVTSKGDTIKPKQP